MIHVIGYVASCETHIENEHWSFDRAGNLLKFLGVIKQRKKALQYSWLNLTYF
jgi:hypothetical protein